MSADTGNLTVDRITPLQRPSEKKLKRWALRQRVFISSTMDDLSDTRKTVASALGEFGAQPVMFETFGARSDASRQSYTAEVRRSQIYLGILSRLYGIKLPSGYSATHEEYEEARERHKEILFFSDDNVQDSERDGHLNRWIRELYQFHVVAKYSNMADLAYKVKTSLTELATDELNPWVKLDRYIFQATHIEKITRRQETTVTLTTACQDAHITSALARLSAERFGGSTKQFTHERDSINIRVESVTETTDPSGNDSLVVIGKTDQSQSWLQRPQSSLLALGSYTGPTGTYTRRDLTELALHAIALGVIPPQDTFFRSFHVTDFKALYQQYGDDSRVFSKLLRLLIVETICQQSIVDKIVYLSVEPVRNHMVHIDLTAMLPKLYDNVEPDTVGLDGDISLR